MTKPNKPEVVRGTLNGATVTTTPENAVRLGSAFVPTPTKTPAPADQVEVEVEPTTDEPKRPAAKRSVAKPATK